MIMGERTCHMELNAAQYAEAIDDFLLKMAKLSGYDDPDCQLAIQKLGSLLRIALIKVNFYMSPEDELQETGDECCLYRDGVADMQRCYKHRDITNSRNVVVYNIYQKADEPECLC